MIHFQNETFNLELEIVSITFLGTYQYKLKHEKADILIQIVILQPTREASSRCANT